jgi:hypothetical protein
MCLVTTLIDFFSPTAHASPWGTVAKRISGTQAGFKAHNLRMWRHSFLPKPKEKTIGRFSTPQQQLDPGHQLSHRLYDETPPPIHHALGTHRADASDITSRGQDQLDSDKAWGLHHGLSV